jgi:hypothetical protein
LGANGFDQRALQIRAMNDQICGAPPAFGVVQRHSHKFNVIRTPQHDNCARSRGKSQHLLERTKPRQDTCRVRGELKPGSKFLEGVGSLVDRDAEACPSQRQCCRQSGDSRTSDDRTPRQASGDFAQFALGGGAGLI